MLLSDDQVVRLLPDLLVEVLEFISKALDFAHYLVLGILDLLLFGNRLVI